MRCVNGIENDSIRFNFKLCDKEKTCARSPTREIRRTICHHRSYNAWKRCRKRADESGEQYTEIEVER